MTRRSRRPRRRSADAQSPTAASLPFEMPITTRTPSGTPSCRRASSRAAVTRGPRRAPRWTTVCGDHRQAVDALPPGTSADSTTSRPAIRPCVSTAEQPRAAAARGAATAGSARAARSNGGSPGPACAPGVCRGHRRAGRGPPRRCAPGSRGPLAPPGADSGVEEHADGVGQRPPEGAGRVGHVEPDGGDHRIEDRPPGHRPGDHDRSQELVHGTAPPQLDDTEQRPSGGSREITDPPHVAERYERGNEVEQAGVRGPAADVGGVERTDVGVPRTPLVGGARSRGCGGRSARSTAGSATAPAGKAPSAPA